MDPQTIESYTAFIKPMIGKKPWVFITVLLVTIILAAVLAFILHQRNSPFGKTSTVTTSNNSSNSAQLNSTSSYSFSGTIIAISGNNVTVETLVGVPNKPPQEAAPKLTSVVVTVSDTSLIQGLKKGQLIMIYADLSKSNPASNQFFATAVRAITNTPAIPASSSTPAK